MKASLVVHIVSLVSSYRDDIAIDKEALFKAIWLFLSKRQPANVRGIATIAIVTPPLVPYSHRPLTTSLLCRYNTRANLLLYHYRRKSSCGWRRCTPLQCLRCLRRRFLQQYEGKIEMNRLCTGNANALDKLLELFPIYLVSKQRSLRFSISFVSFHTAYDHAKAGSLCRTQQKLRQQSTSPQQ